VIWKIKYAERQTDTHTHTHVRVVPSLRVLNTITMCSNKYSRVLTNKCKLSNYFVLLNFRGFWKSGSFRLGGKITACWKQATRKKFSPGKGEGVSKSFRTESITKYALTFGTTRSEATQRVMAAKLTRLTHEVATQLHVVAESCTLCSSCTRLPVRKLLDTPSYTHVLC
jgi:hypothetical protein